MANLAKTIRVSCLVFVGLLCLSVAAPARGQFGKALKIAEQLRKEKEERERKEKEKETAKETEKTSPAQNSDSGTNPSDPGAARRERMRKSQAAPAGKIVFSAAPIDPAKPENLVTEFKSGDSIYALVQTDKTWRDLLGKGDAEVKEIQVPLDMLVDDKTVDFQYITIKNAPAIDSKLLIVDIAPDPAKMTAYKDEGFAWGEGKGGRKIGPDTYTYNLGQLAAGKHTVKFQVRSFGKVFSAGEFTISGDDYKPYTALREKVLQEMLNVGGMPKSQKTDIQLEATMMKLLQNAGWKNIRRLVIVDKDWWNDLASGGNSAVIGRHIGAAVAAKAEDGTYFWSNVTFQQNKLIDGSFGALELSKTGIKRPIKEENIDK
ncbi:MAG: hypothetical protein LLG01_08505 [Planctomycetaceae bacterium]|nr:hypothetical protein [Planctomycetaceae bacterium]